MRDEDQILFADLDLLVRKVHLVRGQASLLIILGREHWEKSAVLDVAETRQLLAWLKARFPEDL